MRQKPQPPSPLPALLKGKVIASVTPPAGDDLAVMGLKFTDGSELALFAGTKMVEKERTPAVLWDWHEATDKGSSTMIEQTVTSIPHTTPGQTMPTVSITVARADTPEDGYSIPAHLWREQVAALQRGDARLESPDGGLFLLPELEMTGKVVMLTAKVKPTSAGRDLVRALGETDSVTVKVRGNAATSTVAYRGEDVEQADDFMLVGIDIEVGGQTFIVAEVRR